MSEEIKNETMEVTPAVIGSEEEVTCEESKRDYLKDGLALGIAALALDGAFHVGKFVVTKAIVPVWNKATNGLKNMKASREAKKAEKAAQKSEDSVEQKTE